MFSAHNCLLAPTLPRFIPLLPTTTTSSVQHTVSSCYRYARAEQVCQDKYCLVSDFIYAASQDLRFFSVIIYTFLRGRTFSSKTNVKMENFVSDFAARLALLKKKKPPLSQLETFCVFESLSVISFRWWKYFIVLILVRVKHGCFPFPRLIPLRV